jgi:hypothetical protein
VLSIQVAIDPLQCQMTGSRMEALPNVAIRTVSQK